MSDIEPIHVLAQTIISTEKKIRNTANRRVKSRLVRQQNAALSALLSDLKHSRERLAHEVGIHLVGYPDIP